MDFQYCDRCGSITQANHSTGSDTLCATCAGDTTFSATKQVPQGLDVLRDPTQELGDGTPVGDPDLDFFSGETLAVRRDETPTREPSRLKLVEDGESVHASGSDGFAGPPPPQSPMGEAPNAPTATVPVSAPERWRVDCLHCAGNLSVRPVEKRSKLRCPRCEGMMVLEQTGLVSAVGMGIAPCPSSAPTSQTPTLEAPTLGAPCPAPIAGVEESPVAGCTPGNDSPFGGSPESLAIYKSTFVGSDPSPDPSCEEGGSTTTLTLCAEQEMDEDGLDGVFGASCDEEIGDALQAIGSLPEDPTAILDLEEDGAYAGSGVPTMTAHPVDGCGSEVEVESPVSALEMCTWMTIALCPAIIGIAVSHTAAGVFGQTMLQEVGSRVVTNTTGLIQWCANLLGA